jgi:ABC-type Fe3+-hydroxamate transport system substrate-binding protein
VSVVDASGTTVTLARPAGRVVSLVPSLTELVCRLGRGDALVGITAYCREPADLLRGKTRIGGEKDPDLTAIRALAPDLVLANVEENLADHVATLRGWGIPVWVSFPRVVDDALALVRDAAALVGGGARAAAIVAEMEARLASVRAAAAARPPVRVFYAIWREPWMTVGGDTYVSDVLRVCGGANVFADGTRYPTVTLEEVAARRPDVVLLPDEPYRFRRAHVAEIGRHVEMPAVRAGHVRLVDGKPFTWHGPRLLDALRTVPALLGR